MERAPERMDKLFETHAKAQYQQDLLFSSQVDLMSLVVCGIQKSVHAAYKARAANLIVSTTALYNKRSRCGIGCIRSTSTRNSKRFATINSKNGWRTTKSTTRISIQDYR